MKLILTLATILGLFLSNVSAETRVDVSQLKTKTTFFVHIGPFKTIKEAKKNQKSEYGFTYITVNGKNSQNAGIFITKPGFSNKTSAQDFIDNFQLSNATVTNN